MNRRKMLCEAIVFFVLISVGVWFFFKTHHRPHEEFMGKYALAEYCESLPPVCSTTTDPNDWNKGEEHWFWRAEELKWSGPRTSEEKRFVEWVEKEKASGMDNSRIAMQLEGYEVVPPQEGDRSEGEQQEDEPSFFMKIVYGIVFLLLILLFGGGDSKGSSSSGDSSYSPSSDWESPRTPDENYPTM